VEGRFIVGGDDEVVLARVLPREGRSRAYIDGRLAPVHVLAESGAGLVDLHGQHANQTLFATATQRRAVDAFGGIDLGPLLGARDERHDIDRALADLGGDERSRARELDLVGFQIAEIERAGIVDAGEGDRLRSEEDALADAVEHRAAGSGAVAALADEDGALDAIRSAMAALAGRRPFASSTERLRSVVAELDDVAAEIRSVTESIVEDPERLAGVRERRALLRDLRRKYGDSLADVLAELAALGTRRDELASHADRVAALERRRRSAVDDERRAAADVAARRQTAAPRLAAAVSKHLKGLGLAKAAVTVLLDGDDPLDDVTFCLAANPGEPALPLTKVASGGELARVMLALRLVLTEAPDTLVFDEVDAGIGGDAAVAVGTALAELGERHQVIVVTHLAQVAAHAHHQIAVSKRTSKGRTLTEVRAVQGDDRVAELARMLSGRAATASATQHAADLLHAARRP
jgi:DNA repair protein RecN (Recombination protein N)